MRKLENAGARDARISALSFYLLYFLNLFLLWSMMVTAIVVAFKIVLKASVI